MGEDGRPTQGPLLTPCTHSLSALHLGTLSSHCVLCTVCEWCGPHNCEKQGSAANADKALRRAEQLSGAELAAKLVPGEWCLVKAPEKDKDEFWLARAVRQRMGELNT